MGQALAAAQENRFLLQQRDSHADMAEGLMQIQDIIVLCSSWQQRRGEYHVSIAHTLGVQNCIADYLSHLSMQAFWQHHWQNAPSTPLFS